MEIYSKYSVRFIFSVILLLGVASCSNAPKKLYKTPPTKLDRPSEIVSTQSPKVKAEGQKPENLIKLYKGFPDNLLIEEYTDISPAFALKEIGTNASGITWDPFRKQYFVIQNNTGILYRYDSNFKFLGKVKKVGNMNNDTEGVSFVDGQSLMVVTEANYAHRVKMTDDTISDRYYYGDRNIQLSGRPKVKNKGFEAIALRPSSKKRPTRIYAGQEGTGRNPKAKMRVVFYNANTSSGTYLLSSGNVDINEPFNAELKFKNVISDLAGMTFEPSGQSMIIVSQESSKAIQVNPETGEVLSELKLSGAPAYEGVTFGPNGELVFVSERNFIQIYKRKKKYNK